MSQKPSFKMEGTLAIDGKSLREALRWANRQPLPGSGMGPFALKAQTSFTGGMAIMLGVNIELDGNVAEGVLAVATEPRVTLKGTLAADTIDLSPYVSTFEVLRSNDRDWSRGPFAIDNLANFDLDLRLSSARVNVVNARLGRTGVAVNLRDARLTLAIGEAQAYGGVLKGAFILSKTETGADVKTQLQFTDVDLKSCLGELFAIRKLEGKGNLSLSLEASGDSMAALTRTLGGNAELRARQGAITGFNVEQLLKRLEQRPLSIGGDFRRGRTPFERLTATAKIVQGMATIEEMRVEGGAIRLGLGGSASIPARELDLRGTAALVSAKADAPPLFELPFVVQGSWDDPIMLPDAQSLISRSNAAAPLLDAVRDRKTRDAVRSVIDRLNRDDAEAAPNAAVRFPLLSPATNQAPETAARDVCATLFDAGEGRGGVAHRRDGAGALRHHGRSDPQGHGPDPGTARRTRAAGLFLGTAEHPARLDDHRAGVAAGVPVPAAGHAQRVTTLREISPPRSP